MRKTKNRFNTKGNLCISCNKDQVRIEIGCEDSRITFLELHVSPEDFTAALGRLAYVPCNIELNALDRVGKVMEHKEHIFELPGNPTYQLKEKAIAIVNKTIPYGWVADKSFNSQKSFFSKDGKQFARTIIRRWVDKID